MSPCSNFFFFFSRPWCGSSPLSDRPLKRTLFYRTINRLQSQYPKIKPLPQHLKMFNQSRPPLSTPILPQHVNDPAFNTDSNAAGSDLPSQSILQSIVRSDTEPNFMARACSFFRPTMFRVSVVILNLVFGILRPLFSYTKCNKVVLILDLVFNIVFVNLYMLLKLLVSSYLICNLYV